MTTHQQYLTTTETSKGHFGFVGKWEYFFVGDDFYRAYVGNPIGRDGYRQGGRWQTRRIYVNDEYLALLGF